MSFGLGEVITLLLGLSGFGVQNDPKAPTADQALQYALPDADLVVQFDAAAVIPGNYKVLTSLADKPQIKASPELAKAVKRLVTEVEGPRGLAKSMTGIDVTTDINDATMFFQFVPNQDPNYVLAVHGKFSSATVDKIAGTLHKPVIKQASSAWIDAGDGNAVALTKDGVLLAGSTNLVKARIADTWKAPAHATGSNLGYAAEVLDAKPVFAVVMTLSQTARTEVLTNANGQNFLTDLVKRHKMGAFAIYQNGLGWTWVDSTKAGLDAMAQFSDGTVDILRAAQIAPRGFAKIALSALDSYKGTDKHIDELIRMKPDLMKLVDTYVGDGKFNAQIDKDPKTLKLNVRLSGKTLSEVLPVGGIVPLALLGFVSARQQMSAPMPGPAIAAPPASLPPPPPPKHR